MMQIELANRQLWSEYPQIDGWLASSRLDPFTKVARTRLGVDVEATGHLQRYLQHVGPAAAKLDQLLTTSPSSAGVVGC
jgi:hypothetical protein